MAENPKLSVFKKTFLLSIALGATGGLMMR
jgi:hypothetical protein